MGGGKRMNPREYREALKVLDGQLDAAEKRAAERRAEVRAERDVQQRDLLRSATKLVSEASETAKAAIRSVETSARDRIRELRAQLAEAEGALERAKAASRSDRDAAAQEVKDRLDLANQAVDDNAELELLQINEDLDTSRHVVGQARAELKAREPNPKKKPAKKARRALPMERVRRSKHAAGRR